jgi:RNA polymerase sigma-70 factor (ECF subfamily)
MTGPDISGRPDRELVLAFQAGDEAAFDELYRRHRERVARVCYRFMNNRPDAEEAAQEAFLKAFQALPRFNGQYQVGAWLSRIAANVCVDNLRVKSRTHLVALPSDDRHSFVEDGPEDILLGEYPEIDVAIDNIQPLHANALKMRALEGLSHVEMAGALDMSPSQVKALLHRARSSFKKAWDKAQGWLLAPILGARSLDRSTQVSNTSSNLAAISAQAPALAERAAASVLIVMVALSGDPSSFSTVAEPDPPAAIAMENGRIEGEIKPVQAREQADAAGKDATAADESEAIVEDELLTLPDTLTSTIEGNDKPAEHEAGPGPTSEDKDALIPPTVKEGQKEYQQLVQETLGSINH